MSVSTAKCLKMVLPNAYLTLSRHSLSSISAARRARSAVSTKRRLSSTSLTNALPEVNFKNVRKRNNIEYFFFRGFRPSMVHDIKISRSTAVLIFSGWIPFPLLVAILLYRRIFMTSHMTLSSAS